MARFAFTVSLIILGLVASAATAQETGLSEPLILIVEVQAGSASSSTEEFVELFNLSDKLISTDDSELKLQYKSSSGATWVTKANLSGQLQPRGRYLIATKDYLEHTSHESGMGLAASGGHLRVISDIQSGLEEYDQVAWGDAQFAQSQAADAPLAGQSLKRILDEDGHFIDTNNDHEDFIVSDLPSPESSKALPGIGGDEEFKPSIGNLNPGSLSGQANTQNSGRASAGLKITELFIDPDKPLTDADDEFVEIHNPTKETVDLEDYVIRTGASFSYSFTLPDISIKSGQYLALFSVDTGLILSNSGGSARLIGPDGKTVHEVPAYTDAKPDTSWADLSGQWQWTSLPTPNEANSAAASEEEGENVLAGTSASGTAAASESGRRVYEEPPTAPAEVNTAVVAGVGAMALLYVGYEYRYDFGNRFHQLKRYLASRRGGGQKA